MYHHHLNLSHENNPLMGHGRFSDDLIRIDDMVIICTWLETPIRSLSWELITGNMADNIVFFFSLVEVFVHRKRFCALIVCSAICASCAVIPTTLACFSWCSTSVNGSCDRLVFPSILSTSSMVRASSLASNLVRPGGNSMGRRLMSLQSLWTKLASIYLHNGDVSHQSSLILARTDNGLS